MKKLILIFACALIYTASCKQKTTKQEIQTQENMSGDVELQEMQICQSCGMPITEDLFGTNADGTLNEEYCKYCYVAGEFTLPQATMNEMIETCIPFMVEQGMTAEDARKMMEDILPTLKRWKQE